MFGEEIKRYQPHFSALFVAYCSIFPIFLLVLKRTLLNMPLGLIGFYILVGQIGYLFSVLYIISFHNLWKGGGLHSVFDWLSQWENIITVLSRTLAMLILMITMIIFQMNSKYLFNQFLVWNGSWDPILQKIDIIILQQHPWQTINQMIPVGVLKTIIRFFDLIYVYWFSVQWISIYDAAFFAPEELRVRTFMNFILIWVLGTIMGGFFASGGPFFYSVNAYNIQQFNFIQTMYHEGFLFCAHAQGVLWENFLTYDKKVRLGISAFPSLHVAISYFVFLYSRERQKLQYLTFAFFITIWIASVVLGWHYFIDGLGAILLVHGSMKISDWILYINQWFKQKENNQSKQVLSK